MLLFSLHFAIHVFGRDTYFLYKKEKIKIVTEPLHICVSQICSISANVLSSARCESRSSG